MPDFCCYPVDEEFGTTKAALVEPLTIGTYSVELANSDFKGKTVGIFGAGPIGLSVLMVIRSMASTCKIVSFEPLEYRRKKAAEVGADFAFDPFAKDAFDQTNEVESLLLDIVFDCSGEQKAIDDATRVLKPGGKLILTGIPPEGKYLFDMDLMRRKEITIINVRRQNHCVEKSIELIKNGLPVEKMVSHRFTPENTQKAFDMVANYEEGAIKVMIDFE
jgi:Threonine dehydrogenase and related Zn-dependent dehydrogenases